MELNKSIKARRSIRKYKDIDVPNKVVEDLINSARLAPSAKNRQPWFFVIVKDKVKDKISDLMIKYTNSTSNNRSKERAKLSCCSTVKSTAKVIKQAPVFIIIFR